MKPRPSLAVSFAQALRAGAESRGFLAYIPWVFGLCIAVGFASTEWIPDVFWQDENWSVSTAVFGGLLAFNGLLMSLGWFAFSKIYEILANDKLGRMLTDNDLLGVHLAFIDVSHIVLILASVLSVFGLVLTLTDIPIIIDQYLLSVCLGFTLYALARAFSATKMMNDLIWEQAHLEREPPSLRAVDGKAQSKKPTNGVK